jgi:hypothetical protein
VIRRAAFPGFFSYKRIIGGITVLFKNSTTFIINGDIEKWKVFQSYTSNRNNKNNKAGK